MRRARPMLPKYRWRKLPYFWRGWWKGLRADEIEQLVAATARAFARSRRARARRRRQLLAVRIDRRQTPILSLLMKRR